MVSSFFMLYISCLCWLSVVQSFLNFKHEEDYGKSSILIKTILQCSIHFLESDTGSLNIVERNDVVSDRANISNSFESTFFVSTSVPTSFLPFGQKRLSCLFSSHYIPGKLTDLFHLFPGERQCFTLSSFTHVIFLSWSFWHLHVAQPIYSITLSSIYYFFAFMLWRTRISGQVVQYFLIICLSN